MQGRRAGMALGAGAVASLPFAVLCGVAGWPLNSSGFQAYLPLVVLTTIASALSMCSLILTWDRGRWQPAGRAAWSGLFLGACVLGAALTGFLVGLGSAAFSLVSEIHYGPPHDFSALLTLPFTGLLSGLLIGFLSLSAPLGGLLFLLLARQKPARSETPSGPAR